MTDTSTGATNLDGRADLDEKVVIVSCDTHIGPRVKEDLAPYCEKKYKEDFDDFCKWLDSKESGVGGIDALDATKGHFDVNARLSDLDDDGTAAEVIFHGSQNGQPIPWNVSDPSIGPMTISRQYDTESELAGAGRKMYNRWLADFCSVEPERHVGLAQLPIWDLDAAIEEATWCREHGLRGINFPAESGPEASSRSRWGGQYYHHDPRWDPFWAAIQDLDMPMASHGGFGPIMDPTIPASTVLWVFETLPYGRKALPRLIFGGVFERFPNLKVVYTEHMGNWWTPLCDDMDSIASMGGLPKLPSEYMKQNVFIGASFQARFEALDAVENDYWKNIVWGNDYPHVEGTWNPGQTREDVLESHLSLRYTYSGLEPDKVKAMLGGNGVRLWGLDGDHLHKVAQDINAPTLRQALTPIDEIPPVHGMWSFRQKGAFG
jgi:predicted TIM-barrel fold metal-dependent hydrolase